MGNNYFTLWAANVTSFTATAMNPALQSLDQAITYHKCAIIGCDGTISWAAGTLTWSGILHIYFTNTVGNAIHNSVNAGNIALADSEFAYVTLSETNNAVITVAKALIGAGSASGFKAYNRLVLGYRNAADDKFYPVALAGVFALSGDMLKATYDADGDGVVDNSEKLEGSTKTEVQDHAPKTHAASHTNGTDDIQDATAAQKGLATAAQITKLDGIEAGADVTDAGNIASSIHAVSEKETPVDNDEIGLIDSAASNVLKKTLWSKIKATLKTYFDLIYMPAKEQSIVCADSITIDWSLGATAYMTFDRATVAFTFSNPVGGQVYRLKLKQDATGGRVATWTTTIKWRGKTAPTLTAAANGEDILTFVYINNAWYGDIAANFG